MANSTVSVLRTSVRKILLDNASSVNSRWSDTDILGFFNGALLEMSRVAKRRKTGTSISFAAGENSKAFSPADYFEMYAVVWETASGKRYDLDPPEDAYPLDTSIGRPSEYWLYEGTLMIRPTPSEAGTVIPVYYRRFTDLTGDGSTAEPEDSDDILKFYALWQALDFDGNAKAEIWKEKFILKLQQWANDENRRFKHKKRRSVRVGIYQ